MLPIQVHYQAGLVRKPGMPAPLAKSSPMNQPPIPEEQLGSTPHASPPVFSRTHPPAKPPAGWVDYRQCSKHWTNLTACQSLSFPRFLPLPVMTLYVTSITILSTVTVSWTSTCSPVGSLLYVSASHMLRHPFPCTSAPTRPLVVQPCPPDSPRTHWLLVPANQSSPHSLPLWRLLTSLVRPRCPSRGWG